MVSESLVLVLKNMNKFLMVLCASVTWAAAIAQPLAYVSNEKSGTVSVIDTHTDKVINEIAVGESPWGVVIR